MTITATQETVTELKPTVTLTQEQIDFYHREGYLVVEAISTPDEIAWLRNVYDRLFASRAGREEGNQFDLGGTDEEGKEARLPQILNPSKYAPELKNGLFRVNALHIARLLLGPDAQAMGEHAIFKPARIGAATPWHQDEAYWNPKMNYNSFSLWMPLQPPHWKTAVCSSCPAAISQKYCRITASTMMCGSTAWN